MNLTSSQHEQIMARQFPDVSPRPRRTGHEGKHLERLIVASQTSVRLIQIPQSAKRIKGFGAEAKKGHVLAMRGPVDFVGIYKPTGRMVIFDAKESGTTTRLSTRDDKLAPHQRAEIIGFGETGAIAGVLACCTETGNLYWCHWQLLVSPRPSIEWGEMLAIGTVKFAVKWDLIARFQEHIFRGQTIQQAKEWVEGNQ